MAKILVVEDTAELAEHIELWLAREKHTVEVVQDGEEALSRLQFYPYDLVVLDWQLPKLSGIEVLRKIRAQGSNLPVLMLTAKTAIEDKESGLFSGADDYLTKPFQMRELSARIVTLLRRCNPAQQAGSIRQGELLLDRQSHVAKRNDEDLGLSPKEFDMLELFMRNPGHVFSLESIQERLWSQDSDSSTETVRRLLSRLRNKINTAETEYISSIHGVGYRFNSQQ